MLTFRNASTWRRTMKKRMPQAMSTLNLWGRKVYLRGHKYSRSCTWWGPSPRRPTARSGWWRQRGWPGTTRSPKICPCIPWCEYFVFLDARAVSLNNARVLPMLHGLPVMQGLVRAFIQSITGPVRIEVRRFKGSQKMMRLMRQSVGVEISSYFKQFFNVT